MSKTHLIKHEDPVRAFELNVQAYVEAEMKRMNQFKFAVKMKTVRGSLGDELWELARYFNEIQADQFKEWDRLTEASDRWIASLLRRMQDKLVKALRDKVVRQMRPVVSNDLHSRLKFQFKDCYHSLHSLRVSHPSFDDKSFYFSLNFDKFDEEKYNRHPEAGFGLCRATMAQLEELSRDFK